MKKSLIGSFAALCGVLALLSAGCKSDQFYQSRAADDAREFLLEHAPELTADQVCYVRYNDPLLLVGEGVGDPNDLGPWQQSSSYIRQICVAWEIPGRDEIYMVCGFSEERMQYWSPNRLIRKKFHKSAQAQDPMLSQSREYLLHNLTDGLTTAEINLVRYTYPTLVESNFDVNFKTNLEENSDAVAAKKEMLTKNKQYSLIWELGDRRAVFTGYSTEELSGWNILFAGILTADEVKQHTLSVVKTPENFNTPLMESVKER